MLIYTHIYICICVFTCRYNAHKYNHICMQLWFFFSFFWLFLNLLLSQWNFEDKGKVTFFIPSLCLFILCFDNAQPSTTIFHPCASGFTCWDCWDMMQSVFLVNKKQKCLTHMLLLLVPINALVSSRGLKS